jgi:hypothetical protein
MQISWQDIRQLTYLRRIQPGCRSGVVAQPSQVIHDGSCVRATVRGQISATQVTVTPAVNTVQTSPADRRGSPWNPPIAFLALVIFSPLLLRELTGASDLNWSNLSAISQPYGAPSALITALAASGIVVQNFTRRKTSAGASF